MGGRGASAGGTSKIYNNLLNNGNVVAELMRNIQAQRTENPNAKVGDTYLDSDRIISNYADTLSTAEYSKFNWGKAENKLFKKLRNLEMKVGFKK
jgi:hypothetical protein